MGERTPLALIDAPASGRMAVGEAITNIAAAPIGALGDVKLSANWMAAAGHPGEDAALYDTVQAVGDGALPGARHRDPGRQGLDVDAHARGRRRRAGKAVTAPLSLIVSAFAPVRDVRAHAHAAAAHATPATPSSLLIDLGARQESPRRLDRSRRSTGSSATSAPDLDDPAQLKAFFAAIQALNATACSSPITTAPTAACSRRCARWRSPATAA